MLSFWILYSVMSKIAFTFWVMKLHFRFIFNAHHQLTLLSLFCMHACPVSVPASVTSAGSSKSARFGPLFCLLCVSARLAILLHFLIFKHVFLQNFYPAGCRGQNILIQWFQTCWAAEGFPQVKTQAFKWKTSRTQELCSNRDWRAPSLTSSFLFLTPPEFARKP